jgi:hypothetical protein
MEADHNEDYAGEHVLPGASFVVFKEAQGWYWKAESGLPFEGPKGPFNTALNAYKAAIKTYEAKFGLGSG